MDSARNPKSKKEHKGTGKNEIGNWATFWETWI